MRLDRVRVTPVWPWLQSEARAHARQRVLVARRLRGTRTWCVTSHRAQDTGVSDIVESIQGGSMPPSYYRLMPNHSGARLSKSEKAAFIRGLEATFKASPPIGGGGG